MTKTTMRKRRESNRDPFLFQIVIMTAIAIMKNLWNHLSRSIIVPFFISSNFLPLQILSILSSQFRFPFQFPSQLVCLSLCLIVVSLSLCLIVVSKEIDPRFEYANLDVSTLVALASDMCNGASESYLSHGSAFPPLFSPLNSNQSDHQLIV